jgi:hypothetical protein
MPTVPRARAMCHTRQLIMGDLVAGSSEALDSHRVSSRHATVA